MSIKATVTDDCISCGACVDICPDVFGLEDGEKAFPKVNPVPDDLNDCAQEAADACPTSAILLEEE